MTALPWRCEYGDLERLVAEQGLGGALRTLFERGVYLTVDEFKGRQLAMRGSSAVAVDPTELRNLASAVHVLMQSRGSRPAPIHPVQSRLRQGHRHQ